MQIKERGGKVVFLRFIYDKEKKRTVNQSVGTQDKYLDTLSDSVSSKMTGDEIAEAQEWLDARKDERVIKMKKGAVYLIDYRIGEVIEALDDPAVIAGLDKSVCDAIYAQIPRLTASLRKAGFKRPKAKPTHTP